MLSLSGAETTCERPGGAGYLPGRGSAGRRIWARGLGALPRPCESQPPIQRRRRAPAPHKYRGDPRQCRVQRAGMLPLPFLPGPHTPGSRLLRLCRTRRKRRPGPEAHILAPCSWFPHRRLRSKLQKHVRVPCRASVKPRSNARGDPCQDKRAWQPQRGRHPGDRAQALAWRLATCPRPGGLGPHPRAGRGGGLGVELVLRKGA